MTSKIRKTSPAGEEHVRGETSFDQKRRADKRKIRRVHPLGFRVLVKVHKDANVTDSGLYLPEGAKELMQESVVAQVIEVASALDTDTSEETNVSGVPLGSTVLIPKTIGVRVPWDDDLRIVETKDILALVDEISLT